MKLYNLIYLALVTILVSGCKKDQPSTPDNTDLSQQKGALAKEYFHRNADQVNVYEYNTLGQLKNFQYEFDGVPTERHEFVYVNGKCSSLKYYVFQKGNVPLKLKSDWSFIYNGDKLIKVTILDLSLASNKTTNYDFTYNNKGFVATSHMKVSGPAIIQPSILATDILYTFTTDGKGNITREVAEFYLEGSVNQTSITNYEFDDKVNIKKGVEYPVNFSNFFCPNNWIRRETFVRNSDPRYIETRTFEYNSENKPIKHTHYYPDGSFPSVRDYEYFE